MSWFKQKRRRGNEVADRSAGYESLEQRRFLATMLYIDFGFGTGDFTLTSEQSAALNAPGIGVLESFSSIVEDSTLVLDNGPVELDFNFDA